jgi:hypothetical protein
VPFEQSAMMRAALEANGVPNMLVSRPYSAADAPSTARLVSSLLISAWTSRVIR